jgi:tetratricopeptide (TPR) repeat protein
MGRLEFWDHAYGRSTRLLEPVILSAESATPSSWVEEQYLYALLGLGNAQLAVGRPAEATTSFSVAAIGIRRRRPFEHNTAAVFASLAGAYWTLSDHRRAEQAYLVANRIYKHLYGQSNTNVAQTLIGLASTRYIAGDLQGALRYSMHARDVSLATGDTIAIIHSTFTLAYMQRRSGNLAAAERGLNRTLRLSRPFQRRHPDVAVYIASALAERSSVQLEYGRVHDAERDARLSVRLSEGLPRANLGGPAAAYAEALAARGRHRQAISVVGRALPRLWDPPLRTNPTIVAQRMYTLLEQSYAALGDPVASRYYGLVARQLRSP